MPGIHHSYSRLYESYRYKQGICLGRTIPFFFLNPGCICVNVAFQPLKADPLSYNSLAILTGHDKSMICIQRPSKRSLAVNISISLSGVYCFLHFLHFFNDLFQVRFEEQNGQRYSLVMSKSFLPGLVVCKCFLALVYVNAFWSCMGKSFSVVLDN